MKVIFLLAALTASATSFVKKTFEQSVDEANHIVRGTAGNTYSDWSTLQGNELKIFTFTEFIVSDVFKGRSDSVSTGRSLLIRQLGGEKDGVAMLVDGTAKFRRGQEAVILLRQMNGDGSFPIKGMMMGSYQLVMDQHGKESLQGPGMHDQKWSVEDLKRLVSKLARSQKQKKMTQPVSAKKERLDLTVPEEAGVIADVSQNDDALTIGKVLLAGIALLFGIFFLWRKLN